MSDQLESQETQSSHQEQVDQEQRGPEENFYPQQEQNLTDIGLQQGYQYDAGNNYAQRGQRNGNHGRQGQQRGGRFGSNKYNYNNNGAPGQYNRYNNSGMGTGNRNYNNGYKPHRRNMNAAAMNMQWQGYYNPQMYYMAPQLAPGSPPNSMDIPSSNSPIQPPASSTSPPASKKIEITTKSGEHLDLSALHSHNAVASAPSESGTVKVDAPKSLAAGGRTESVPSSEAKGVSGITPERKVTEGSKPVETISEAEKTKREFLEQIKKRKAALEKKKLEQSVAQKTKPTEVSVEEKDQPTKEEDKEEVPKSAELSAIDKQASAPEPALKGEAHKFEEEKSVTQTDLVSEQNEEQKKNDERIPVTEKVTEQVAETGEISSNSEPNDAIASLDKVKQQSDQAEAEAEHLNNAPDDETEQLQGEGTAIAEKLDSTVVETPDSEVVETGLKEEAPLEVPSVTVSQLFETLRNAKPIEDIYSFKYPEGFEAPDSKYKKSHIKYTYGPTFLLQFKDKVKATPDEEWVKEAASKIVIPPGTNKSGRQRDGSSFGGAGGRMNGGDFRKSGSIRNMDGRSNSRNSSKKKSKRMMDDRRSNRSYTSRRDRERGADLDRRDDDKPKEEVAPLVPSANRWVPKSKQKKVEKRMAPDGVTELLEKDEVERKMKSLLNKLTLEMFDKISSDILAITNQSKWETNGETLSIVIEQIFIKACDEPHWSSMYAQLCGKVVKELDPEITDEKNEGKAGPKLVLHYLVARCHAEFDKGWTDKLPTNEDGTPLEPEMMSDEYYKAAAAKRRGLGLVRFIGFLYRLNLLTGKMMFECFRRLMKDLSNNPSEETLESVVELLSTVGEQFETDSFSAGQATLEGSALLDSLFANLQGIIETATISSRMKFKLVDIKELREKHWNSNKKEDGPKTIQQIHEEEKERQQKNNNSRSNSRRINNSMGGRNTSRREAPAVSKDNFITTRASSLRHVQKSVQKEEPRQPQMTATNMFNALMDSNDDDD